MKHIAPDRVARFQTDGIVILTKEQAATWKTRPLAEISREWDEKQAKLAAEKAKKPE